MTSHNHTEFDEPFWQDHWQQGSEQLSQLQPHPYVAEETGHLAPGTALDAGCGRGAEAQWLAEQGWQVTAVDISETVLEMARHQRQPQTRPIEWIRADLTTWEPNRGWDLVLTSYAHTPLPQLAFYARISEWVAPGGTLLIIAHQHDHTEHGHHSAEATVQANDIVELFPEPTWQVRTVREQTRDFHGQVLDDVIVRLRRQH